MKKLIAIGLLALIPSAAFALPRPWQNQKQQQRQQQKLLEPNGKRAGDRPLPPRQIAEKAVLGLYVTEFQRVAEVSPEVFGKIFPFLQEFIEERFELGRRRTRALNQIKQAIARGTDDELPALMKELDGTDAAFQNNQVKFLGSVDPFLNARQRAKARILLTMVDNQIRQTLQSVQNPNQQQQRQNAPVPPQN